MNIVARAVGGFFILAWLVISLYFGISGYLAVDLIHQSEKAEREKSKPFTVGVLEYSNEYIFSYEMVIKIFPYLNKLTGSLALVMTAMAFGALGGVTRLLKQIAFEKLSTENVNFISIPLIGMLSGIFILGVAYVIPTILVAGDQRIRPETLLFLSLFSGLFSSRFYGWLSNNFNSIFKSKEQ